MDNTRKRSDTTGTTKSQALSYHIHPSSSGASRTKTGVLGLFSSGKNFLASAYDSDKGQLWGRDWLSWVLILSFYLVFYMCLLGFTCGLFYLWRLVILDRDNPKYSGPDEGFAYTPGVSHIPILDPEKKSTLIRFTRSNDSQIGYIKDYMYDTFLKYYEPSEWTSENGNFIDCSSGRTNPDPEMVCEFKLDAIRPCVLEDDYGWADGQPCIIIKLNKVNNWVPENYDSIDDVPVEIKSVWKPNVITVRCFGSDPVSRETVGKINYYPQQGWSFDYYPFTGQQGYRPPLVAAQFMSLPHRVVVFITCKAYTKNMIYQSQYRLGESSFELISD